MEPKAVGSLQGTIAKGLMIMATVLVVLALVLILNAKWLVDRSAERAADNSVRLGEFAIRIYAKELTTLAARYDPASPTHDLVASQINNISVELGQWLDEINGFAGNRSDYKVDRDELKEKWDAAWAQLERLLATTTNAQARQVGRTVKPAIDDMVGLLSIGESGEDLKPRATDTGTVIGIVVLALAILMVAVNMFGRGRAIATRTRDLTGTVQRMADGELDITAEVQGNDELATIAEAVNEMTHQIFVTLEKEGRFFTLASHLLCIIGYDGRFKRFSQAWERVLGKTSAELIEAPVLDFIYIEDRQTTARAIQNLIDTGTEIARMETRCVGPEGETRWLSWNLKTVPVDELIYCVAMEITERRQAEADREKLHESIQEGAVRLSNATSGLVTSTGKQTSGAQEQAAAIAETVAAVEEVEQTTRQAASRATAVAESSQLAVENGKAGRKAVEDTIVAMERVRQQVEGIAGNILTLAENAQNIGEIVTSVDHIADQTNLLALNAAIEAARAGEQGKGFTVVANEIRLLADQSKRATVQVRQMLMGIQKLTQRSVLSMEEGTRSVDEATSVVTRADDTIRDLVEAVTLAATSASQILASANQQSVGMRQIHNAMQHIQEVTAESLEATQKALAAVHELNGLAESMRSMLHRNGHVAADAVTSPP